MRRIRTECADAAYHIMARGMGDESRVTQAIRLVKRQAGPAAERLKKRWEREYASSVAAKT